MPDFIFQPVPHDEAIDFLKSKPAIARAVFDQLLPELQGRAFTIAGIESANVLQNARDIVATLPAGRPWDVVKKELAALISPFLGGNESALAKAELLLRVHGHTVYAAAADRVAQRQAAVFPYWQYQTMGDSKVRASHRTLDGLVLPANSPFWKTHNPPWEFGCRCIKIVLSDSDRDEIAAKRPELVLDPQRLRRLEQENVIERFDLAKGTRQFVDVAPTGNFRFNPNDLTIGVDELRARYDAPTWNAFERWARKAEIPEQGRTVWDWVNDSDAAEPLPPEVTSTGRARRAPISDAMEVKVRDRGLRSDINEAIALIDRVHDDGEVPRQDVRLMPVGESALGDFSRNGSGIRINLKGPWRRLTFAHETGHALDYFAFGSPRTFASAIDASFQLWREAIDASEATKSLKTVTGMPSRFRDYFLSRWEQFARSYAQYIAYKSQDAALIADVERVLSGEQPWRQWKWDDFKPIAAALDELFTAKGWLP